MTAEQRILVAYASKHGSTREVADTIADALRNQGDEVEIHAAADVTSLDGYHGVILGGSIYFGRWHSDAAAFLERHRKALARTPLAVFALGPQTLEVRAVAESRAQLDRALAKATAREPELVAVFGGGVDPAKLRFPLSRLPASDARDWDAIRAWAAEAAAVFRAVPA